VGGSREGKGIPIMISYILCIPYIYIYKERKKERKKKDSYIINSSPFNIFFLKNK
jgi:hypothetical protein